MNEELVIKYITETFAGVDIETVSEDCFFSYNSGQNTRPDRWLPFATLVTSDTSDQFSNLNRPGVFRLNIGISKQTYQTLFGTRTEGDTDFTALDRIMPHPVYGKMYWVCVLNPSAETFEAVAPLLAEAYNKAAGK